MAKKEKTLKKELTSKDKKLFYLVVPKLMLNSIGIREILVLMQ